LLLWAALLGVRLVLAAVDHATGHPEGSAAGVVLFSLAVSFAGQNAVVLARTLGGVSPARLAQPASRA
jgi:hypothetical protein